MFDHFPQLPPVPAAILAITGIVLAIVRLLTASKAFWWAFPEWVQKGLPAALVALGALPTAIEKASSWLEIVLALLGAASVWFTASRGDKRPVEGPPASGSRSGKKDPEPTRVWFENPRDPDSAAMTSLERRRRVPRLVYGLAFLLLGCTRDQLGKELTDHCSKVSLATIVAGCKLRAPECVPGDETCPVYLECKRAVAEWRVCSDSPERDAATRPADGRVAD